MVFFDSLSPKGDLASLALSSPPRLQRGCIYYNIEMFIIDVSSLQTRTRNGYKSVILTKYIDLRRVIEGLVP